MVCFSITRGLFVGVKHKHRINICLFLFLFVLLSTSKIIQAQERILPAELASQYTVRKWVLDDGLPDGRVCGVTSGADA